MITLPGAFGGMGQNSGESKAWACRPRMTSDCEHKVELVCDRSIFARTAPSGPVPN